LPSHSFSNSDIAMSVNASEDNRKSLHRACSIVLTSRDPMDLIWTMCAEGKRLVS
jgi:hypothetical protein